MPYLLILFFLAGCARVGPTDPQLELAASLVNNMRGDDGTKSIALLELAEAQASTGRWQQAEQTARSIQNYRLALAFLEVAEQKIIEGRFEDAARDLVAQPNLAFDGIAQQRWEIISRQLSLAEAVGIYPAMLAAMEKAGVDVPPMFRTGDETKGGSSSTAVPAAAGVIPGSPKAPGRNLEASEGGEKLMGRMKVRMGMAGRMARARGFLATGQAEEARQLLLPVLLEPSAHPFPNLASEAEFLCLAIRGGLRDQAAARVKPVLEGIGEFPVLDSSLGSVMAAGVELASLEGQKDKAQALVQYGREGLRKHSEFSRNENLARMGVGCWRAGMPDEARACWEAALEGARQIPNPRSRAVGAFEVLMAQIQAGAPLLLAERTRIVAILKELPEAYAKIGQ
jgi:hypothetical protein